MIRLTRHSHTYLGALKKEKNLTKMVTQPYWFLYFEWVSAQKISKAKKLFFPNSWLIEPSQRENGGPKKLLLVCHFRNPTFDISKWYLFKVEKKEKKRFKEPNFLSPPFAQS